jgi:transcriptional regulator of NAD metabolism
MPKSVKLKSSMSETGMPGQSVRAPDSGEERRRRILEWMRAHPGPVSGNELAQRFRVSRQCLVQDVAILRAGGAEILATPRGYQLPQTAARSCRAILASRHEPERTEEELQILADHGVKVLDVIVEHPLYGELRGSLMLESRTDVRDFIEQVRAKGASLLSSLTHGVHLHTVEASRPEMIERAKAELHRRGFLLK